MEHRPKAKRKRNNSQQEHFAFVYGHTLHPDKNNRCPNCERRRIKKLPSHPSAVKKDE